MTRCCIYNWLAAYRSGGWDALKAKKLYGRPKKLTGKQMELIYKIIIQGNPQQYRFGFALWTLGLIQKLIYTHYTSKCRNWRMQDLKIISNPFA
jgi:transposase